MSRFKVAEWVAAAAFAGLFAIPRAAGQNVYLAVKAFNPASATSTVPVRANLPAGVGPAEITDAGGMETRYDAERGVYYMYAEDVVPPGGNREYRVGIKDIWTIPQETLDALRRQAALLGKALEKSKEKESALQTSARVGAFLDRLEQWQARNRIGASASAAQHIQSYEKSKLFLAQVKDDIGMLEDQALGEEVDLERLYGPPKRVPPEEEALVAGRARGVFRIGVGNPSAADRLVPVKRYLPKEVRAEDVSLGEENLEVRYDTARQACYLYSAGIPVKAGSTVELEIAVADRWVTPPELYASLHCRITNVQAVAKEEKKEAVMIQAQQAFDRLAAARKEEAPAALSEQSIAFHRQRMETLRELDETVQKLEDLLSPPKTARVFRTDIQVKPPSRAATWLIVYIVLGFLALVSILFFLRWYGRGKDEKIESAR